MRVGYGISGTNILSVGRGVSVGGGGGVQPLPVPVPELGDEIHTESNAAADPSGTEADATTGWSATAGGGTMQIESQSSDVSIGDYALRGYGASGVAGHIVYLFVGVPGTWYRVSLRAKKGGDGSGPRLVSWSNLTAPFGGVTLTDGWQQYVAANHAVGTDVLLRAYSNTGGVGSGDPPEVFVDDVSIRPYVTASLFSVRDCGLTHATTKASISIVSSLRAGVVANLDDADNPQNFVMAVHDGANAYLIKCVDGTYTTLINIAAAYSAGATIEIRRLANTNTYQLWYDGSQVGTDQAISDEGIVSNTLHGYVNTYSGNTLSNFACAESV